MDRIKPGTAVIFKEGSNLARGVVVKYSKCYVGSQKMFEKIKRQKLILVQVNNLRWVPRKSIVEILGEDFWFHRR